MFFFQSVDNKQYTNYITDLNIIAILFILDLDITIGLIHVIAQQTQKCNASTIAIEMCCQPIEMCCQLKRA